MDEKALAALLKGVRAGNVSVDDAVKSLKDLPFAELGYATVDTHRSLRFGFPEVVYGEHKTAEQVAGIVALLVSRGQPVLATRLSREKAEPLIAAYPKGRYSEMARLFHLPAKKLKAGRVTVVCAGTSDLPVAEEA